MRALFKKHQEYKNTIRRLTVPLFILILSSSAHADFLEMPDVKQTPELHNKSLLRDMDIPAVKFRNPDPNEGPRLAITEFRIQGLVEYPKMGITREALKTLSERIRFDMMGEGKLLESGYTISELGEVSDLLGKIEEETAGRHVEPVDVQRLVWLVREQRTKRGITLGQIETVANTITQFYRERGFVLAKAYIPKQEVRDGVVNLTVLLGMLGEVQVSGNKVYSSNTITSVFDDMLGKPITSTAVEEKLFLINDYPGIFVDGHFEPGYQVGDTRLNVTVKDEDRYNADLRVDNHGTSETGLYRFFADVRINDPFGMADKLQASFLHASDPSNNNYWQLLYQMKLFGPRTRITFEGSDNQFLVDQSNSLATGLNLHGDVTLYAVTGTYIYQRNRKSNSSFDLRYESILSNLQLGSIPDIDNALDDKLKNLSLVYHFDSLNDETKRFHQGQLMFTSGHYVYGADPGQPENYHIYSGNYLLLDFLKIPFFDAESRLVYRAEAQYAGINLSGIMRYSLSGPTRARAFVPGIFTADDALYLGVDWIFNSPGFLDMNVTKSINVKEVFKPFVFVDYAYGQQHSLVETEPNSTAQLADVGVGLKISQGKSFSGNLLVAFPIEDKFEGIRNPPSVASRRLVFDFQYSF
jgi:hemolysin activation/secretion protein